jgi:hypothetical protein
MPRDSSRSAVVETTSSDTEETVTFVIDKTEAG